MNDFEYMIHPEHSDNNHLCVSVRSVFHNKNSALIFEHKDAGVILDKLKELESIFVRHIERESDE